MSAARAPLEAAQAFAVQSMSMVDVPAVDLDRKLVAVAAPERLEHAQLQRAEAVEPEPGHHRGLGAELVERTGEQSTRIERM